MKKNLFLTCALALFAIVGVSAQEWSRTLATGLPGKQVTHEVNGVEVTQYRAETALLQKAGATGVRYTVVETTQANGVYGGGPFFAMGEMIVLDANGDTINFTVTSNADHNSGGAGTDGAGLPAINDGNLGNFFHSSWGGTEPGGLHYLELTFAEPVDAFQLVWYTRPNQHVNRPTIVGLTEPEVEFTEDMLFAEYQFELGDKVTTDEEIANGGAFTFYVEGPTAAPSDETITGPGNIFVSLSGYQTGANTEAGPSTIVQLIPGDDGTFVLYQPVSATYYGSADKWTDAYNGKNGWQRASDDATRLGQFEITATGKGDFEITTKATRLYADDAWSDLEEPLKLWVGYDMRGNLKLFPQNVKEGLEQGDYTVGFGLPVDFGFEIYKANVSKEMVPDKSVSEMCTEILAGTLELAREKQEEYAEFIEKYDSDNIAGKLEKALTKADLIIKTGDLAGAFAAQTEIEADVKQIVALKNEHYNDVYYELAEDLNANFAEFPYTPDDNGKYSQESLDILDVIYAKSTDIDSNFDSYTYAQIEAIYAQIESLIEQFKNSTLKFSTFPEIVSDIPADNFPYSELPNNAVWKKNVVLTEAIGGVRLTFLERHLGSAGDGGNFPMIALGEIKLYDQNGTEVALDSTCFEANYTETQEGFESTVARLCDGNFGARGYYHSPWSGNEPQEYIWIDIDFPSDLTTFTVEVYSRDKSTSQNVVSLFPKKVAITEVNEGYDPLLFAENPYNVFVGEKVTSVDQITADGLYVIKGLLNTQPVLVYNEDSTELVDSTPQGKAMFYHGTDRFHAAAAAVRAQGVYRFIPNADGTFKALNLGLAKYWPSTEETGFVGNKVTYEAEKAANLTIKPSTNVAEAFVMYEFHKDLVTVGDSIDADEDGIYDSKKEDIATPYVVYMDWANSLATRPVKAWEPFRDADKKIRDAEGDALCFNKANGEAEWEIYKVTMENPDFYWLTNLTAAFDQLGLVVGTDPGCVSNLGALEAVLAAGQKVVADSAYAEAPAAAEALAKEIAAVNNIEKNPMEPGVYMVVSAYDEFKKQQNVEKALYANVTEDGTPTFGWKNIEQNNIEFYFDFQKSENATDLVESGTIKEEYGELLYTIRAIATYEGATPYYIGEVEAQSTQIDLFADASSDYLVLNATGSAFNFRLAGKGAGFSIHANGHGSGAGTGSNIVYWDGAPGASQWYLRKVDYETSIDDFVVEGTEVVAVSYFTPAGAAVPAPVKGVNIVVTVYANGVVETKKVLVK